MAKEQKTHQEPKHSPNDLRELHASRHFLDQATRRKLKLEYCSTSLGHRLFEMPK